MKHDIRTVLLALLLIFPFILAAHPSESDTTKNQVIGVKIFGVELGVSNIKNRKNSTRVDISFERTSVLGTVYYWFRKKEED